MNNPDGRDLFHASAYHSTGGMCPTCGMVPRGVTHACLPNNWTSPPSQILPANQPWICPRCQTVNAWWVAHCRCKAEVRP